jgi:hypothetical protein
MFRDSGTEEFFMCPNDAAFTEFAPGVIAGSEYAGLAVERGKLRGKVLAHFLDEATQKTPRVLTSPVVRRTVDAVGEGIAT